MADPRTFTVKQCSPAFADKSGASIGSATNLRRDFFNAVGKIGDVEVMNSVGGGKVARGLRTLASVSNSIRVGDGAVPSIIGSTLDTGANWVLGTVGIAPTVVDMVRPFNPGVANAAVGQAKNVFQSVKQGGFKAKDIPFVLQDFQNLERLARGIYTPGNGDVQTSLGERCDASAYALDMIARAPKYKFLFIVQFVPAAGFSGLNSTEIGPLDMAFAVKTSTRPNIKYVYEDINMYNFRTKVITKAEFEPMSMKFHDDTLGIATNFYHSYMRAMSPITGIEAEGAHPDLLEQSGMDFVNRTNIPAQLMGSIGASNYAASTGPLYNDNKEIFKEIRVYHLYAAGHKMNVWRFFNPRITELNLDDLDMSASTEGSELSLNFNYDSMFLDPEVDLATTTKYDIGQVQRGALYPLRYNGDKPTSTDSSVGGIGPTMSLLKDPMGTLRNATATASNAVASGMNMAKSAVGNAFGAFKDIA